MRFLMIGSGRRVPSTRFRLMPYIAPLERAGHRCTVMFSYPAKYEYYRMLGWRLSQRLQRGVRHWQAWRANQSAYDAIFLEREIFDDESSELESRFRKATRRFVLDVDDGIFVKNPAKFAKVAAMADHVVCGNRFIAEYTQPIQANITIIPTCIEAWRYPARSPHASSDQPVIGWIGTGPNVRLLQECAGALRALAKERKFRLHVIAAADAPLSEVDLAGVDVRLIPWSEKTEIQHLHQFDIGIMPLPPNDPWMKYKCAAKLLQYLAVGIPAVASPVGVNADILAGNQVGFAANNIDDWIVHLRTLLDDVSLRQQMGDRGRDIVHQQYTIEANWQRLEKVLRGD
jgi:glycosyltransferase involved in cell wall biosynthesis